MNEISNEIANEIAEIQQRTARTRLEFLRAETQTCITALELGEIGLSGGNTAVAEREVAFVEKGIRTIERFLPEVTAEQRSGFEAGLSRLRKALDSLKIRLTK